MHELLNAITMSNNRVSLNPLAFVIWISMNFLLPLNFDTLYMWNMNFSVLNLIKEYMHFVGKIRVMEKCICNLKFNPCHSEPRRVYSWNQSNPRIRLIQIPEVWSGLTMSKMTQGEMYRSKSREINEISLE